MIAELPKPNVIGLIPLKAEDLDYFIILVPQAAGLEGFCL